MAIRAPDGANNQNGNLRWFFLQDNFITNVFQDRLSGLSDVQIVRVVRLVRGIQVVALAQAVQGVHVVRVVSMHDMQSGNMWFARSKKQTIEKKCKSSIKNRSNESFKRSMAYVLTIPFKFTIYESFGSCMASNSCFDYPIQSYKLQEIQKMYGFKLMY